VASAPNTALGTPAGRFLKEGYVTRVSFALNSTISLWIKSTKPPGVKVDPIDITTMHNTTWETMWFAVLKQLTEGTFTAAYDPNVYSQAQILSLCGRNGGVSLWWPDLSYMDFWGALTDMDPSDHKRKEFPEMSCKFQPSNWDDTNFVEAGPAVTSVPGT